LLGEHTTKQPSRASPDLFMPLTVPHWKNGLEKNSSDLATLANEVVRTSATNDIVLFRSPATWTREDRHGKKIYEQWQSQRKEPELTT